MTLRTLVIAPHPDDEILGCAGTLLRRKQEGSTLGWLIVTAISEQAGWDSARVKERDQEIATVTGLMGFDQLFNLRLPAARLDELPTREIVAQFAQVFNAFQPTEVFVPHCGDVHTDHRVAFDAAIACTKWFRFPSVRRVLAYETLSETDFALPGAPVFQPNLFVDISQYLERKIEAMTVYKSELGQFPFPRSVEALRALAALRGAAAGFQAAEAFQLLRERY